MVGMGRKAGISAIALAMMAAASGAMGAAKCTSSAEVTAIQAAAIQQDLMVAALTCSQIDRFNAFQTGYSKELRTSDNTLQRMFRRLYGIGGGDAAYHAFKTRLANNASIHSIHDNEGYCHDASVVFDAALITDKPTLASFVSGIGVSEKGPVDSCVLTVNAAFPGTTHSAFIVPKPNPMRIAALTASPISASAGAPQPADDQGPPTVLDRVFGFFGGNDGN
jgi:hypothetical protein